MPGEVKVAEVELAVGGAPYPALLALPRGNAAAGPALLVAPEASGLTGHTREIARRAAAAGHVALAFDLFPAGERPASRAAMLARVEAWRARPAMLSDICAAGHALLTGRQEVDPDRIGGFGYCMGAMALLDHAREGAALRAIVGFHGGMSANRPDKSPAIRARLLMCVGAADPLMPAAQRASFEAEMTAAGVDWRMIVYGGVQHSFTNPEAAGSATPGIAYHAAADADSRAAAFRFLAECGLGA